MANKRLPTETRICRDVERVLARSIPPGWSLKAKPDAPAGTKRIDLLIEVASSAGETARFAVEVKRSLEPRSVPMAAEQISTLTASAMPDAIPVVAAGYLSPRTRELLDDFEVGYIDTTGNVRLTSATPWLTILTQGADSDPWPQAVDLQSLRGRGAKLTYAATGAFAAQRFNPVAPARAATLYVNDAIKAADRLGLRETEAGANVVLLEPFDPLVFERATIRDGLRCAAASQLAVDLLTGPGREPSQGEEILEWMKENEDAWRT
ncbi:MAG: hypothetical protein GY929_01835 [Actinomycetia bacterium]|nr:hypothetical protein [Actinomycetes bacterium]